MSLPRAIATPDASLANKDLGETSARFAYSRRLCRWHRARTKALTQNANRPR
ncbi:hypothetical protein BamIOP4010DRAFT_4310 [Burkholderia ambifaria IOP40-10]|uniref:Uncharacterized protein n=1 Tax=Burkholderia ambifaria IOP40-10 TaxID=396596 RepID=B1FJU9_9BURK|nr:hypothetical protein BamIOP4010DRAFT_4310 [Burkholderia ambifaria IOP40-10]